MAKEKPRLESRGDGDFTRYLFLISTTFDHMFWPFRETEYTEHTEIMGLFVRFGLQNRTIRTKKDAKNAHGAVGVIEITSSSLSLIQNKSLKTLNFKGFILGLLRNFPSKSATYAMQLATQGDFT